MRDVRRRKINEIADHVRATLELDVPVDVEMAIERLGGCIVDVPAVRKPEAPEAYVQKDGERFTIGVRQGQLNRRRFSVAHEIGHLFLHMGYLIDEEKWSRVGDYKDSVRYRYGYSAEEYEANEFAGAFLMPRSTFTMVAYQHMVDDKFTLPPIAEYFQVSRDAVKVRGQWLGLFSWD